MSRNTSRSVILSFLVALWLLPPTLAALTWADLKYWHYFLVIDRPSQPDIEIPGDAPIQRLKQSILNIRVDACDGSGVSSGTSFVISPGYVATAAHVVKEHRACGNAVELVDYRGLTYRAELEGYSDETQLDLALLSFSDTDLAPLPLADSTRFEDSVSSVLTIGYPPTASTSDEAAVSSAGNVSNFREGVFFTSGMDLNPGNSGGPVFLTETWTVLGVATAKGDPTKGGEGLGFVVPSVEVANFFEERIGRAP